MKCEECTICFQKLKKQLVLPCNHAFHSKCISKWFNKHLSCPICRQNVSYDTALSLNIKFDKKIHIINQCELYYMNTTYDDIDIKHRYIFIFVEMIQTYNMEIADRLNLVNFLQKKVPSATPQIEEIKEEINTAQTSVEEMLKFEGFKKITPKIVELIEKHHNNLKNLLKLWD